MSDQDMFWLMAAAAALAGCALPSTHRSDLRTAIADKLDL